MKALMGFRHFEPKALKDYRLPALLPPSIPITLSCNVFPPWVQLFISFIPLGSNPDFLHKERKEGGRELDSAHTESRSSWRHRRKQEVIVWHHGFMFGSLAAYLKTFAKTNTKNGALPPSRVGDRLLEGYERGLELRPRVGFQTTDLLASRVEESPRGE